ncbi:MAG: Obg family GTPase CgtA, partial [Firmicutes bacterium]|nr:Obg family GTPase CgtA [Bacillota bacterium]
MYDSSFVMADIPGLIEGASEGQGLGLDFLKHIERTRILIHVVDVSGSEGRDPKEDLDKINAELASYSEKLAKKPQIVCANKIDMVDDEAYEEFKAYAESKGYPVYPCSAPIHEGVDELLRAAYQLLQTVEEEEEEQAVFFKDTAPEDDPDYRSVYVQPKKGGFLVTGKQLEKIFNSTNFNDAGSLRYLYRYIEESGAIDEMLQMGLEEGDTITVIDYDFEYYDE